MLHLQLFMIIFAAVIAFLCSRAFATNAIVPVETPIKLCKNCKYFNSENFRCSRFKTVNVVTGKEKEVLRLAKTCRNDEKLCGLEGKYYEFGLINNDLYNTNLIEQLMLLRILQKKDFSVSVILQMYELINSIVNNMQNIHH